MLHGVAVVNLMAVTDVIYVEMETRVLLRIGEESEELMRLRSRMLMSNLEERVRLKHVMWFFAGEKAVSVVSGKLRRPDRCGTAEGHSVVSGN